MNESEPNEGADPGKELKDRPSRARYNKVKATLDLKWRRRELEPERMMREIVDALWDAFGDSPWSWCGFWLFQQDRKAFQPGPARPGAASAVPSRGLVEEALTTGDTCRAGNAIAVLARDKNGRPWAVLEARSSAAFDDMDARWMERLLKAFQTIERSGHPPLD